ncbi:MAG TPA: DMT family transporter [Candidatus Acidoferrales bacterium]|nr:DMT family transporter [Candidatus Acidoferrales bacterium]
MTRTRAELALVGNAAIWGATFVLVKAALGGVSPAMFLAARFSVAAAALLVLFRGIWKEPVSWKSLAGGGLTGIFLYSGFLLQTLGLRLTTAPKSAFITGLSTVMVPLLAALVYRIRPQVSEVAGVLVATAGMGLMTLEGPVGSISGSIGGSISRGDWLTFSCAIAFAAHIVTLGHFSGRMSFELLSVMQVGFAALAALLLLPWVETPQTQWRSMVIWAIMITGLLATALAFTVQAWAQHYTTATRTALIYSLEPVFAWMTSYCITGESLSGRAAAGAALILSGVVLVEMKPFGSRLHPFK